MAEHKLVSMKQAPPKRETEAAMVAPEEPAYPYGLRLDLGNEQIEQLAITTLPKVGTTMLLVARVDVVSVRESEDLNKKPRKSVELQITDMALGADEASDKPDAQDVLYKK